MAREPQEDEPTQTIRADEFDEIVRAPVETVDAVDFGEDGVSGPVSFDGDRPPFEMLGHLDRGGMGEIQLVRDNRLNRVVARKMLLPEHGERPSSVARFVAEAQLTAQLDHPNIVPVYRFDSDSGLAYTMKLVQGSTLQERIRSSVQARRNPPVPEGFGLGRAIEYFLKVCDAIAYAHDKGVVHRDLKPENIMVGDSGEVYVMDWGLARTRETTEDLDVFHDSQVQTRAGHLLGTPAYMAPEQARGELGTIGPATDQYALGLILFEIVTGRSARAHSLPVGAMLKAAAMGRLRAFTPVSRHEPLNPAWEEVICRATALEPGDRYPSVRALADAVRQVRDMPDGPVPTGRFSRWVRRNAGTVVYVLGLLSTALALLAAGVVVAGTVGAELYASAAKAREARLTEFLADVGGRAQDIDRAFSALEAQVESVAGASGVLLNHGEPSTEPILFPDDFADGAENRPADTAWSESYARNLSLLVPDIVLAPGVPLGAVEPEIRRLMPVRHVMRRAHLETRRELDRVGLARAEQSWRELPGPVRWAIVGTPSGIYYEMPGAHWSPVDFEPRSRPWYTVGVGKHRPTWGRPFQEASSGTLLIPCSMEIPSPSVGGLGIASLSISFDYLIERFLAFEHPAVRETFLVDEDAHIMVRSSEVGRRGRTTELDEHWETPPFPEPRLATRLLESGVLTTDDGATLLFHYPLSASGWSYVVEVDAELAGQ